VNITDFKILIRWGCPHCDEQHEDEVDLETVNNLHLQEFECFGRGCGSVMNFDVEGK
jgi:hypothetical protein